MTNSTTVPIEQYKSGNTLEKKIHFIRNNVSEGKGKKEPLRQVMNEREEAQRDNTEIICVFLVSFAWVDRAR